MGFNGFRFNHLGIFVGFKAHANKGRPYYEETGKVVWDINTEDKIVALTFDDGPHPKYTAAVLDLLAKFDAKATFLLLEKTLTNIQSLFYVLIQKGMN